MIDRGDLCKQVFYEKHLLSINGIKFTSREVDIIACLINGRSTKKIASLFSISPRTVDNHLRNIMLKLECNSRESIIDFIEISNKFALVRQYYSFILIQDAFNTCLKEIAQKIKKTRAYVYLCGTPLNKSLTSQLESDLTVSGVTVIEDKTQCDKALCIFLNEESDLNNATDSIKINFDNYYESVFIILMKLVPNIQLEETIAKFRKASIEHPQHFLRETDAYIKAQEPSKKKSSVWTLLSFMILLIVFFCLYFRHNFERDRLFNEKVELTTSWAHQYKPLVNQGISNAKFYEWRGNALNIPLARKMSQETKELSHVIEKDLEKLKNRKTAFENSLIVLSPLNWNLYRDIRLLLEQQEFDFHVVISLNKASEFLSHDSFVEAANELDNNAMKDLTNEIQKTSITPQRKKILQSYMAIAINMSCGVAKKRLLDTKEIDKEKYIKNYGELIKEINKSAADLDNSNFHTFLNVHRLNIECAILEENLEKKRHFEEAAKCGLNRGIEIAPGEVSILQETARHYKYTKENDRSLLAYDSALELAPENAGILFGRAELYLNMGEEMNNFESFSKAFDDIKKANELKPNDCDIIEMLVWASLHVEDCTKAETKLEKLYKPLCNAGNDEWDDVVAIREESVKRLEKKLNDRCYK